jgi:hypothetical protein
MHLFCWTDRRKSPRNIGRTSLHSIFGGFKRCSGSNRCVGSLLPTGSTAMFWLLSRSPSLLSLASLSPLPHKCDHC